MANILENHQKSCGVLQFTEDGDAIICEVCGARVIKKQTEAIIETEGLKIGIL